MPETNDVPSVSRADMLIDHEARIRLLERDSVILAEGMKSLKETMSEIRDDLHSHISELRDNNDKRLCDLTVKFDEHVDRENKDRTKMIAALLGNTLTGLAAVASVLFALWEFSHK